MLVRVWWLLAALLSVHAPVWLLQSVLYVQAPLFNYDYFLSVGLMVLQPWIGVGALVTAYSLTWLIGSASVYRFKSWTSFFDNWGMVAEIDWASFLSMSSIQILLAIATGLYVSFFCARRLQSRPQQRVRLLLICAILLGFTVAADALNGSSDYIVRNTRVYSGNIGSSSLYIALKELRQETTASNIARNFEAQDTLSGQFDVLKYSLAHPNQSILMVAVESLGMPESPELRAWLRRQVRETESYRMIALEIPFKGATTNAELRHLCQIDGSYKGITSQTFGCLPLMLQGRGWNTLGFHGFTGTMFNRARWWPLIGIGETHFIDSPELANFPRCGGMFDGVCDDALIALALQRTQVPRTFAYVLTLDTHLPVQQRRLVNAELQGLCDAAGVSREVCIHIDSLGRVLAAITIRAGALRSGEKPLVVIFGDHAPPFVILKDRLAFMQTLVPAFVLANTP